MINLKAQRAAGIGSVILVGGVALNAVLNYGFGVALAWLLTQEQFGAVGVLLSMTVLAATVLAAGFPWTLARTMARAEGSGPADGPVTPAGSVPAAGSAPAAGSVPAAPGRDGAGSRAAADAAFRTALVGNLVVGLGLAAGLLVLQASTGRVLPGAGWALTATIAVTVVAQSVYSVLWGASHGSRLFDAISLTELAETAVKAVAGLAVVGLFGFGVQGVALVLLASVLLAAGLSLRALGDRRPGWGPLGGFRAFASAVPTAVGTICAGLLITVDVLLLGTIGPGLGLSLAAVAVYQAAAVLARAPYLLGGALSEATFPFVAGGRTRAEAHRAFLAGFRWVPLALVPIQLVFVITPESVIGLLFPDAYDQAASLCRLISVGTLGLIVADMLLKALLARGLATAVALRVPFAVAVQIVGLLVLMPRLGAAGAALAFSAGAWVAAGLLGQVYARECGTPLRLTRALTGRAVAWTAAVAVLAAGLWLAGTLPGPLDLPAIGLALLSYLALAVWWRVAPADLVAAVRGRLAVRAARRRGPVS